MISDTKEKFYGQNTKARVRSVYFVMELKAETFQQAAERMRHEVFVEELGWVKSRENRRERDDYDAVSTHLGLFRNREIIGHVRMTRRPHAFMLEREFAALLPPGTYPEPGSDTAEISRLCVSAKYRSERIDWEGRRVFLGELLYHCLWKWCQTAGIVLLYFATTPSVARLLRLRGFPCLSLAEPDPDLGAVACRLDWREYAKLCASRNHHQALEPSFHGQSHSMAAIHGI